MKRLILLLFIFVSFSTEGQINVIFMSDIPPLHVPIIYKHLQIYSKAHLPDTVRFLGYTRFHNLECGDVLFYLGQIRKFPGKFLLVTYRVLTYQCTDDWVDGFTIGDKSIITLYNCGTITRLSKLAMHELGHSFGLDHCINKGCFMESGGFDNNMLYDKENKFCNKCRKLLKK